MAVFKRGARWAATAYDPALGRKRHVGTYDSKGEAQDAEHEARRTGHEVTADAGEFALSWVGRYPRQRESTNIGNRERVSKFAHDFRGRRLSSITRVEARAWALANRSRVQSVRAMFSDALRDGLVRSNPFAGLRFKRSDGRRHLVVPTEVELGELALKAGELQGEWGRVVLGPLILFAAHTGLRPGELYGLRWEDIDLSGRIVSVNWQWSQTERKLVRPKYDSTRRVFLPDRAVEALDQVARVRDEVFSAPRGGRLSGSVLGHYWPPVARGIGRPDFTPHGLRHYYGTLLAGMGLAPYEIAAMMGHQDGGKLAMDRYIHMSEADARAKVAAAFGSNVRELRPVSGADSGAKGG